MKFVIAIAASGLILFQLYLSAISLDVMASANTPKDFIYELLLLCVNIGGVFLNIWTLKRTA